MEDEWEKNCPEIRGTPPVAPFPDPSLLSISKLFYINLCVIKVLLCNGIEIVKAWRYNSAIQVPTMYSTMYK